MSIAAALGAVGLITRAANKAGDMISPAKGKTTVSTKEGGLFEMSPNDDLIAGPGLATAGGGAKIELTPVVSAINTLKQQVVEQQTQIELLRKDMKGYFGLGGTVAKQIGTRTATALVESS